MTRPGANPAPGGGTGREGGPGPVAESRLVEVGIELQYMAAVCGVSAGCAVQVGVTGLVLSGVDGSPIRVVEAYLRFQYPDDAALLAAVLRLPAVPRRSVIDDWTWRGWLAGDAAHDILLSVTLSSASGAATRQSPVPGDA